MPTNRRTGRQGGRKPPAAGGRADGRRKCTLYLPAELIRQLKHLAVDEDKDLGQLAAPKLRELVGQRYQVHPPRGRPDGAPADGPRLAAPEPGGEAA